MAVSDHPLFYDLLAQAGWQVVERGTPQDFAGKREKEQEMGREEFLGAVVEKLREVDAGPGRVGVEVEDDGRIVVSIENGPKWEPDRFHPHVLAQSEIWIDKDGKEHQIAEMPRAYIANVLGMLFRSPAHYRRHYIEANPYQMRSYLGHEPGRDWLRPNLGSGETSEQDNSWLTRSPLVRGLMEYLTV